MSKDREKIIEIASKIAIANLSPGGPDSNNIYNMGKTKRDEIINVSVDSAIELIDRVNAKTRE